MAEATADPTADTSGELTPEKVREVPGRPRTRGQLIDRTFFGIGTLAAIWLAWALLDVTLRTWWGLLLVLVFWVVLAYLALPRLNRILTSIYVPSYFIGRTRTSDGLLGDPLNLAFRGTPEQLSTAFLRAGWIRADPIDLRSSARIVLDTVRGRSYPEAPVSPLFLFDRQQDAAYQQEVDGSPGQRHHVRVWRTPAGWPLPGGTRVDWLAGGTYDRRVGLTLYTLQVTHKIDADIDVERDHIVSTISAAEPSVTVEPLRDFTTSYHSRNGGGDAIHTDGTLPIVDVTSVVPDPAALPIDSAPSSRIPPGVLVSALIVLGSAVLSLITAAIALGGADETSRAATILAIVIGVAAAGLALMLMLRRSDRARQLILALVTVEVLARIAAFQTADGHNAKMAAIGHAAASVLVLIALSTQAAREWATGRRDAVPE